MAETDNKNTQNTDFDLEAEDQYSAELAAEQELYSIGQQIEELAEKGRSFGRPSFFKYGLLLFLAILADAVIVGSYLLFGTGIILSTFFAAPLIISVILVSWFTDTKLKDAQAYPGKIEQTVVLVQQRIAIATRTGLKTAKALRKVPGMKSAARALPRKLVQIRKVARRSPVGRTLIGSGANIVPIINLVPWQVVSVLMAYSAEKKTLEEVIQATNDAIEQLQLQAATI